MNSERNIVNKLFENHKLLNNEPNQPLDEKTYTVGDKQYWRRNGKCYCWDASSGKKECSEDEYMKALSGGKDEPVKNTEPSKDKSKIKPKKEPYQLNYNDVKEFDHTTWDIEGQETTIQKTRDGGYYLQNDDYDMDFEDKRSLIDYLRDTRASFAGYDSDKDY